MKKLLVLLFTVILTIGICATEHTFVFDNADLYTDEEEAQIVLAAEQVLEESGLLCIVLTDYGIYDVLDSLYDYAGDATDMVMLTVDMSEREFEIYQYNSEQGESAFRISYDESQEILDDIFDEMADGYYADAAIEFVMLSQDAFSNADNFVSGEYDGYEYVDYDEELTAGDIVIYFLLMLLVGMVIGGIAVLVVWLLYKRKVHGSTYPLSQYSKLNLTASHDNFITKNVVVTTISDSSSGSGGGGGSRSGGGARMGGRSF